MRSKPMTPDEVLERAQRAESRSTPDIDPQLGVPDAEIVDERDLQDPDWLRNAQTTTHRHEMGLPPPTKKSYCDSCGYVDSHAPDCPQQVAIDALREAEREELLEAAQKADDGEIMPLVRKIGARILRRIAKRLDP